jgi:hypothetical protein
MRRTSLLPLVLLVSVSSAACAHARGIRVGEGARPRPPDCELAYERAAPADAQARWRQVGIVCASGGEGLRSSAEAYEPGEVHDALKERACALGGEIVSPTGLCSNGRQSGIEFGVYVR